MTKSYRYQSKVQHHTRGHIPYLSITNITITLSKIPRSRSNRRRLGHSNSAMNSEQLNLNVSKLFDQDSGPTTDRANAPLKSSYFGMVQKESLFAGRNADDSWNQTSMGLTACFTRASDTLPRRQIRAPPIIIFQGAKPMTRQIRNNFPHTFPHWGHQYVGPWQGKCLTVTCDSYRYVTFWSEVAKDLRSKDSIIYVVKSMKPLILSCSESFVCRILSFGLLYIILSSSYTPFPLSTCPSLSPTGLTPRSVHRHHSLSWIRP